VRAQKVYITGPIIICKTNAGQNERQYRTREPTRMPPMMLLAVSISGLSRWARGGVCLFWKGGASDRI
jgi:hypothetical protein